MKAVIYARFSSEKQNEASIEGQLRECMDYAERTGLTIIGNYIDRALSARTDNRPEFRRMIKDSAKGCFEVVLVWKLDRFFVIREYRIGKDINSVVGQLTRMVRLQYIRFRNEIKMK